MCIYSLSPSLFVTTLSNKPFHIEPPRINDYESISEYDSIIRYVQLTIIHLYRSFCTFLHLTLSYHSLPEHTITIFKTKVNTSIKIGHKTSFSDRSYIAIMQDELLCHICWQVHYHA